MIYDMESIVVRMYIDFNPLVDHIKRNLPILNFLFNDLSEKTLQMDYESPYFFYRYRDFDSFSKLLAPNIDQDFTRLKSTQGFNRFLVGALLPKKYPKNGLNAEASLIEGDPVILIPIIKSYYLSLHPMIQFVSVSENEFRVIFPTYDALYAYAFSLIDKYDKYISSSVTTRQKLERLAKTMKWAFLHKKKDLSPK